MAGSHSTPTKSSHRVLKTLAVIALVIVLLCAGVLWWLSSSVTGNISRVKVKAPTISKPAAADATNFLVLGSDVRLDASNRSSWARGGARTDAMMLVQFSRKHNAVTVMSIPRDAWVDIPGHGKAKINAAFAYGGPSLAIETVQDLTGVPIDHFAIVNFETFSALTDALGSVEIETTRGPQQMNGTQALAFVRERKSLPGGDFDRVKRQQAWMRAIMAGIFSEDVLSSPSKALNLIQTASQDMTLDEGLGTSELLSLAKDARHVRPKDVTFITAPYTGTDTSADGQSIVNLDYEVLQPLAKAWAEDNLPQYLQGAGAGIPQLSKRVN